MNDELARRGETVSGLIGDVPAGGPGVASGGVRLTQKIGPYTLGECLGEGGFGAVFAAAQEGPIARRVAIKLLRAGAASAQVLARFRREQHVLALMKHPHIAQVYDAGESADGQPFIVMELVEGPTITRYCDDQKLGIRQRLGLFRQICDAVQHAHVRGIIHRDIKPSNVLVATDEGRPIVKVIDFGIARPVDPGRHAPTVQTQERQLIGTPAYMSPEQARGSEDIDTRSDVYSLGVVLYELVAGLLPIDPDTLKNKSADQVDRIINEQDPPSPSTRVGRSTETRSSIAAQRSVAPAELTRMLRGELDWVVMKCLEKSPDRRYQSAAELSADIERHLSGAAVVAAPPSSAYRFRKFVRRNRLWVAVGAAVLASLSIGLVATLLALGEARAQERLARREASRSRAFVELFVEDVIGAAHPAESEGQDMRVSELVGQAESGLDSIADATVRADVQQQIGRILMGLGKYERAYEHLAAVVALREKDPLAGPGERASSLLALAAASRSLERDGWGLEYAKRALAIYREAYGTPSILAAAALRDVAEIHQRRGDRAEARALMLEALAEAAASEQPGGESEIQAKILMDAAVLLHASEGNYFQSTKMYREALDILARLSVPALTRAHALASYARFTARAGNAREAVAAIDEAVAIARRAYSPDNPHLASYCSSQATVYALAGRLPEAEALQREAIAICERTFGLDAEVVPHRTLQLVGLLEQQGRQQEAIPLCAGAREIYLAKFGPDDARTLNAQSLLGDLHRMVGSYTEAERMLLDAEARLKRTGASPVVYSLTRTRLASLYSAMGNRDEASKWLPGG